MNSSDSAHTTEVTPEMGESARLRIEVYVDFICPWCLIGKRNLDAAMRRYSALLPAVPITVLWRSHQLIPATPLEGIDYQAFYLDRLGSAEAVAARRAQVQRAGEAAGVEFAFERIEVLPNTAAAHQLAAYAASLGNEARHALLIDRLFTAYFIEGENIGDQRVLERLAIECGLEREALKHHLASPSDSGANRTLHAGDHVNGVPHFVFNGQYVLSGARSVDTMVEFMMLALRN